MLQLTSIERWYPTAWLGMALSLPIVTADRMRCSVPDFGALGDLSKLNATQCLMILPR